MKKFIIAISLLMGFFTNSFAQIDANKGDYVMVTTPHDTLAHFVFKSSNKVCYNYNIKTNIIENEYKKGKKLIKETFEIADKINFKELKGEDETKIENSDKRFEYFVIEYRKDNIIYRICVLEASEDPKYKLLMDLRSNLYGLW